MSVVDSHVHLLPGRLAEKVRSFFAPIAAELVYPLDHGVVREQLAAEGVGEIWNLPYAHKPAVADGLNEASATLVRQPGPLTVVGGATVHPGDADPTAVVRRAVEELGLRVLKLHCSVGDYSPDDARLDPVWDYASRTRLPVVVHAGHAATGLTEAHELAPVDSVAQRHPEATVIIAHCAHPDVGAALDLVERHPNVYADLTPVLSAPVTVPPGRLDAVAAKLLFGSDAPNTAIAAGVGLDRIRTWPLPADAVRAVTGETARRLQAGVAG